MHFLQMHDLADNSAGTWEINAVFTLILTHQQGLLSLTAHKLFCWHKGHRLVSIVGIRTISLACFT